MSLDDIEFDVPADNSNSTEEVVENKVTQTQIRQIWREINVEERMLLEQKYILQWKDEEIAASLGIQPQSVRMRLTRAKRNILKELQTKGITFTSWL